MDIKNLISQMTLEEKASLLSGADFWRTKKIERLGIPSTMVSDGPHGLRKQDDKADHLGFNESIKAVCFPAGCAAASSFSRELFEKIGSALGDECQNQGVSVLLGPAINIKRSPLCGRNFEYLSEDPYLAGELTTSYTKAVQKKNIGVSLKHFAANNQEHRRMSSSSDADERTLREIYLAPFENAVKNAKPWTVMCSYNRINGTYSSENKWLLTDVLRNEWGFDGYVMTDWGATVDRVEGVKAGVDLEMPSSDGINDRKVIQAVKNGELSEADVDRACENLLRIIYRFEENRKPGTEWNLDEHHELSGKLAEECMVLLKNEENILPLREGEKIAFIGEYASKPRYQGGGSSHINSYKITSALEAVKDIPNISYEKGFSGTDDVYDEESAKRAVELARISDKVVIFAGLPDSFESEGYDREHMNLPSNQNRLIQEILEANRNVIVVLHNGSPVALPWIKEVKAVLESYLAGQNVGSAQKNILFGKANPSGRLAESFPLKLEDNPSYLYFGGEGDVTEYREGIFVGYRYYDKKNMDVLFPFGHGLSYTTFEYSNLRLSEKNIKDTDTLKVYVDVTNTGSMDGMEVVQLYVANSSKKIIRPSHELKGFEKVHIRRGDTRTVTFELSKRSFAYFETKMKDWAVESGDYVIQIGKSSRNIVLEETVHVDSSLSIPKTFTLNSIYIDVTESERNKKILNDFLEKAGKKEHSSGSSDAANEAITPAMIEAMMRYSPLRQVVSFTENITPEQIDQLLKDLNE